MLPLATHLQPVLQCGLEKMPQRHQLIPVGEQISGRYVVLELIGRGGFAEVYKCEDLSAINKKVRSECFLGQK